MHPPKPEGKLVFQTPWFEVLSKELPGSAPHYTINSPDFVAIIAVTPAKELLLVRQFRHGAGAMTLELVAGHVEKGDTPEETARKELFEETGYTADRFELLATLSPSTARFTNRIWCFFAADVRPVPDAVIEEGIEPVLYTKGIRSLLKEEQFCSAPNWGVLGVALANGKLSL